MIDYDTFPFKLFFQFLKDESKLKDSEISKKDWEYIKEEWNKRHPTPEHIKVVAATKKIFVEAAIIKRLEFLLKIEINYTGDDFEDFYKEAGVNFKTEKLDRMKYLSVQIDKSDQKIKIFNAQLEKLQEQLEKDKKVQPKKTYEETIADINEVLASFEIAGIAVGEYEKMTMGRYEGLSKSFEKKAAKQKANK